MVSVYDDFLSYVVHHKIRIKRYNGHIYNATQVGRTRGSSYVQTRRGPMQLAGLSFVVCSAALLFCHPLLSLFRRYFYLLLLLHHRHHHCLSHQISALWSGSLPRTTTRPRHHRRPQRRNIQRNSCRPRLVLYVQVKLKCSVF